MKINITECLLCFMALLWIFSLICICLPNWDSHALCVLKMILIFQSDLKTTQKFLLLFSGKRKITKGQRIIGYLPIPHFLHFIWIWEMNWSMTSYSPDFYAIITIEHRLNFPYQDICSRVTLLHIVVWKKRKYHFLLLSYVHTDQPSIIPYI